VTREACEGGSRYFFRSSRAGGYIGASRD